MRKYLKEGTKVRLDTTFANSSIVEVVSQTSGRLYTKVKSDEGHQWEVMTNRLEILNENENGECNSPNEA
jgi:hypothetical protein